MPLTVTALTIFLVGLLPGLVHYAQRRALIPQRPQSPLVEVSSLLAVSIVVDLIALGLFGLLRTAFPNQTPDVERLLLEGMSYFAPRVALVLTWGAMLLVLACLLAAIIARRPGWLGVVFDRFAPTIVHVSAWYAIFDNCPPEAFTYVTCELKDESLISGYVGWYSVEVAELPDRDLVLYEPLMFRAAHSRKEPVRLEHSMVIVAAREMAKMYVSYVASPV